MRRTEKLGAALAGAALACCTSSALAAGGHFAVDDARVAAAGECGTESWFAHADGGAHLVHVDFKCGTGPVELGVTGEASRGTDLGSASGWGLQAKWAHALSERFSIGAEIQPAWQSSAPAGYVGTAIAALATWAPSEKLAWHVNLGRDLLRGGSSQARSGLALEWTASKRWLLVGERFVQQETHFVRAGARWQGGEHWSVDASRAQRLAGPLASHWTVGVNIDFGD